MLKLQHLMQYIKNQRQQEEAILDSANIHEGKDVATELNEIQQQLALDLFHKPVTQKNFYYDNLNKIHTNHIGKCKISSTRN